MIKRIFRKRLRRNIVIHFGSSHPDFERVFKWIYKAPIWDWNIMLFCIRQTAEYQGGCKITIIIHLDKAEELLEFLSKN